MLVPNGFNPAQYFQNLKNSFKKQYAHLPEEAVIETVGWITGRINVILEDNTQRSEIAHYLSIIDTLTPEDAQWVYEEFSPKGAKSQINWLFKGIHQLQRLTDVVTGQKRFDFPEKLNEQYYAFLRDAVTRCCKELGAANKPEASQAAQAKVPTSSSVTSDSETSNIDTENAPTKHYVTQNSAGTLKIQRPVLKEIQPYQEEKGSQETLVLKPSKTVHFSLPSTHPGSALGKENAKTVRPKTSMTGNQAAKPNSTSLK